MATAIREHYHENQQVGPVVLHFASVRENGKNIARFPDTEEGRANARFLASAPKLLAACQKALAAFASANELGKSTWSGADVDEMKAAVEECESNPDGEPLPNWDKLCCGYSLGKGPACCEKAGKYNGFGSDGPVIFSCPKKCGCHD